MRKLYQSFFFLCAVLILSTPLVWAENSENPPAFKPGETITFAVTKVGIKTGQATLVYQGPEKLNDRDVKLIIFTARALNFLDEEKIYVDPKTFFPIMVKRNLNIWGKKETITEDYSSEGVVKITKIAGGKVYEQKIEKKGRLDNIYCFVYRYRQSGNFKVGERVGINLPTKDVLIKMEKMGYLKVANQVFDAYYMKSEPPQFQLWFDSGPKKLPLKMLGAIGFGDTAMVMIDYKG